MSEPAVEVFCFTNIDDYKLEEWPTLLQARPLVGERVTAKSGKNLKVVAISHLFDGTLRVELHK